METQVWVIQVITWMSAAIMIMGVILYLRYKFQKQASLNILVEYITPSGNGYDELVPEQGGVIIVPPQEGTKPSSIKNLGKMGKGRAWAINELSTFHIAYPQNYPRMFQTQIRKVTVRTDTLEPVSNLAGESTMTPEMFYDIINEQFTSIAVKYSQDLKSLEDKLSKQPKPGMIYVWLILITVGVIAIGFWLYRTLPGMGLELENIKEILNHIKNGMGI